MLNKLEELSREHLDAVGRLRKSLMIQTMVPNAFDHGTVSIRWFDQGGKRRGELTQGDGTVVVLPPNAWDLLK